ncbi:NAD(P)H-dependent oxidoreductase subunit E [bacterium]|nr:NAD(P)H-dependent oxidoreductase subunit E [bacterium]
MLETDRLRLSQEIEDLAAKHDFQREGLLPILQAIKNKHNHISDFAMQEVARLLAIHPVEVYGVVSFYSFLSTKQQGHFVIRLCRTISCDLLDKEAVACQLENELGIKFGETTKDGRFSLFWANCLGMCDQGPAMLINDYVFTQVTAEKVFDILECCRKSFGTYAFEGKDNISCFTPVKSNIQSDKSTGVLLELEPDKALKKALEYGPEKIVETIKISGLKGRGGAGFPTHIKWELAAKVKSNKKYVVCNADEGEPGTFKDRVLLSDYSHVMLEGMTIAGLVIGAKKGIIYLRGEYSYLLKNLKKAIDTRHSNNLLGNNILGDKDFSFDIDIRLGSGAYICGEETALIESLEGQRGEPRNRPPFPVDTGYNDHPTIVNNVETFAMVAHIIAKGPSWLKRAGTEKSSGTKLFSVSGNCKRPGIYEMPYGITINELLILVGGEEAKAVQVGGASGRCVPRSEFDHLIAYEDIPTGGSIIVFNNNTDMLGVAENFLQFFNEESCGQCTPCRIGNTKLLESVKMLKKGQCSIRYLRELQSLGETMQLSSKCGLGQSAPNAFLSITKHFTDEILGRNKQILEVQ